MSSVADPGLAVKAAAGADAVSAIALLVGAAAAPVSAPLAAAAATVLDRHAAHVAMPQLSAFVAGNCTLTPLVNGLKLALLNHGFAPRIAEGGYDQWAAEMLDPDSALHRHQPSVVVLVLSALAASAGGTRLDDSLVQALTQALPAFRARNGARLVIVLPEPLEEENDPTSPVATWRRHLCGHIQGLAGPGAILVDPALAMAESGGATAWYGARYWYHAKLPFHPNAMAGLGWRLAATVAACVHRPIKVVACDLDNTLWGGVVGEAGADGLSLAPHGTGGPFLRLQAYLARLKEAGFLLAMVSKNNEADAKAVFDRRPEMLLQWNDFAATAVNWRPKSENLRAIAAQLRLDSAHFCFLDDSPFERAEVRNALPEMYVPEISAAPESWVGELARSGRFQAPVVTAEDGARGRYYAEEARREIDRQDAASLDDFLAGLGVEVTPLPIGAANLERVVQLVQKTNQFNLASRRHDAAALRNFCDNPGTFAFCYGVADRFGDSGIVGVLVAPLEGPGQLRRIDTWLLSCRVIGRTVEHAMLEHLMGWMRGRGENLLWADYRPSAKNAPIAEMLPKLGFQPDDNGRWMVELAQHRGGQGHARLLPAGEEEQ